MNRTTSTLKKSSLSSSISLNNNVKARLDHRVLVKVKPTKNDRDRRFLQTILSIENNTIKVSGEAKTLSFDKIYDSETSLSNIVDVRSLINGVSQNIVLFGHQGSGKSYSADHILSDVIDESTSRNIRKSNIKLYISLYYIDFEGVFDCIGKRHVTKGQVTKREVTGVALANQLVSACRSSAGNMPFVIELSVSANYFSRCDSDDYLFEESIQSIKPPTSWYTANDESESDNPRLLICEIQDKEEVEQYFSGVGKPTNPFESNLLNILDECDTSLIVCISPSFHDLNETKKSVAFGSKIYRSVHSDINQVLNETLPKFEKIDKIIEDISKLEAAKARPSIDYKKLYEDLLLKAKRDTDKINQDYTIQINNMKIEQQSTLLKLTELKEQNSKIENRNSEIQKVLEETVRECSKYRTENALLNEKQRILDSLNKEVISEVEEKDVRVHDLIQQNRVLEISINEVSQRRDQLSGCVEELTIKNENLATCLKDTLERISKLEQKLEKESEGKRILNLKLAALQNANEELSKKQIVIKKRGGCFAMFKRK
jgi:hypothetical protein